MGFRKDAIATVWEVESVSDTVTKGKINIRRKNKETDAYETEFSGFVKFYGTATAKKAALLKERDRIKLGDVDVTNKYDKDEKKEYTYYKVFTFSTLSDDDRSYGGTPITTTREVDDGEPADDSRLPF